MLIGFDVGNNIGYAGSEIRSVGSAMFSFIDIETITTQFDGAFVDT